MDFENGADVILGLLLIFGMFSIINSISNRKK